MKTTPLTDEHRALGARLVEFAGYEMPVQYGGIYEEAAAVRTGAGMFDVSHMARLLFEGPGAESFLRGLITCDVGAIKIGGGAYGLVLNESAGILDDVILYRESSARFLLVVNASNHAKILAWIKTRGGVARDLTAETAMIAVQGPAAAGWVVRALPAAASLGYFGINQFEWPHAGPVRVARTGYTGEDGFELIVPSACAAKIWNWLRDADSVPARRSDEAEPRHAGVTACGLGSRDVLRIEAGYSLYGSDMDESSHPYEVGLRFAVTSAGGYCGADALAKRPVTRVMTGLDAGPSAAAMMRHGYRVLHDGRAAGVVTSGVYSKYLGRSIGFAVVDKSIPADAALQVEIRGKAVPVRRTGRRFVQGRVRARLA